MADTPHKQINKKKTLNVDWLLVFFEQIHLAILEGVPSVSSQSSKAVSLCFPTLESLQDRSG